MIGLEPKAGQLHNTIRRAGTGLFCLALSIALARATDPGVKAQFVGGTVAAPRNSTLRMDLTSAEAVVFRLDKSELRISYGRINAIEYGQRVSRRYAEAILLSPILLLSKSRKHYITLGYRDEQENQQALVLRMGKGDIRAVLAGLEARTGRRVEYQDNEARKGGKE